MNLNYLREKGDQMLKGHFTSILDSYEKKDPEMGQLFWPYTSYDDLNDGFGEIMEDHGYEVKEKACKYRFGDWGKEDNMEPYDTEYPCAFTLPYHDYIIENSGREEYGHEWAVGKGLLATKMETHAKETEKEIQKISWCLSKPKNVQEVKESDGYFLSRVHFKRNRESLRSKMTEICKKIDDMSYPKIKISLHQLLKDEGNRLKKDLDDAEIEFRRIKRMNKKEVNIQYPLSLSNLPDIPSVSGKHELSIIIKDDSIDEKLESLVQHYDISLLVSFETLIELVSSKKILSSDSCVYFVFNEMSKLNYGTRVFGYAQDYRINVEAVKKLNLVFTKLFKYDPRYKFLTNFIRRFNFEYIDYNKVKNIIESMMSIVYKEEKYYLLVGASNLFYPLVDSYGFKYKSGKFIGDKKVSYDGSQYDDFDIGDKLLFFSDLPPYFMITTAINVTSRDCGDRTYFEIDISEAEYTFGTMKDKKFAIQTVRNVTFE